MNRQTLLALIVWAIDIDELSLPFPKAWERFQKAAAGMYKVYTDPSNELLYRKNVVGMDPINFFTDYLLYNAGRDIRSGLCNYGKYDNQILNYKKL